MPTPKPSHSFTSNGHLNPGLRPRLQAAARAAWFVLPFALLYGINARAVLIGDSQAHFYLAASFAWSGDADLREFQSQLEEYGGGELPYFVVEKNGHIRSIFNFFPAILLTPFFWFLGLFGGETFRGSLHAWGMAGKLAATLFVFASGLPLWGLLRGRVRPRIAKLVIAGFWVGTPLWPTSVDYLQHNPMIFFKLAALWALFGANSADARRPHFFWGGLALAFSVLCRYQTLPSAIVISLFVLLRHRGAPNLWNFLLGGVIPVPLALAYHSAVFGSPFALGPNPWLYFDQPLIKTSFALLFNPSKGLAVHSPWIALGIGVLTWRTLINFHRPSLERLSTVLIFSAVPTFLLYSKLNGWFGGWCWGYRYLFDILPEAVLLAAFGLHLIWRRGALARLTIAVALSLSIIVQSIGALCYDTEWHRRHDLGVGPSQSWLWQLRHSQIAYYARRGTLYLAGERIELFPSPFEDRGLYDLEYWGEIPARWTEGRASFLYVARRSPATLIVLPNPKMEETKESRIIMQLNAGPRREVELIAGRWNSITLESIPHQHSAVVTIEVPDVFREESGRQRELGVALDMRAIQGE